MKNQFIGVAENCKHNCIATQKQNFNKNPHVGQHNVLSNKDYVKKLTNSKILSTYEIIENHIKMIQSQTQKIVSEVIRHQQQTIKKLQIKMFECILDSKVTITKQLISNLMAMGNLDHQKLSCQQMHQIFSAIGKQPKNADIQSIAQQFFNNFKNNLSKVFNFDINNSKAQKTNQLIKDVNKQKKQPLYEQSQVTQYKLNRSFNSSLDISLNFENQSQQSNFYSTDLGSKTHDSEENSLINELDQLVKQQEQFIQKKPKGQTFFNKNPSQKQNKQVPRIQHKKSSQSLQEDKKQQKQQQQQQQQYKKQQNGGLKKSQLTFTTNQSNIKQDVSRSYVDKKQGRYFIKVAHLFEKQYTEQKATFNIKLKVVQQLMFRLFRDSKSNKTFRKAKFVGGDQTGIIVCYTNYIPQMRMGQTIILLDCELSNFYKCSYQIVSHKCRPFTGKERIQKIYKELTISKFQSIDPLKYSVQKLDDHWPSICGIQFLAQKPNKNAQIIAKIQQIVFQTQKQIACYLYDGTGTVYAQIELDPTIVLKKGGVYYFKKIQIISNKFGKQKAIYFKTKSVNQKDASKKYIYPMDEFLFDDIKQSNISEKKKIDQQ